MNDADNNTATKQETTEPTSAKKVKPAPKKKTAKKAAPKKTTQKKAKTMPKKAAEPVGNASEFIRKYPNKTADEIAEMGKKAGHNFKANYVYTVRSNAKTGKKTAKKTSTTGTASYGGDKLASEFLKMMVQVLGKDRLYKMIADM